MHTLLESQPKEFEGLKFKTYQKTLDIYLKDSNSYQNVYFCRYFEWQGICRESWFAEEVVKDFFALEGVLSTKMAHNEYIKPLFPFQKVTCLLNTYKVRQCSLFLLFRFFNQNDEPVSIGYQKIGYVNKTGNALRLPKDILEKIKMYTVQEEIVRSLPGSLY